jgi:hypothetical protein
MNSAWTVHYHIRDARVVTGFNLGRLQLNAAADAAAGTNLSAWQLYGIIRQRRQRLHQRDRGSHATSLSRLSAVAFPGTVAFLALTSALVTLGPGRRCRDGRLPAQQVRRSPRASCRITSFGPASATPEAFFQARAVYGPSVSISNSVVDVTTFSTNTSSRLISILAGAAVRVFVSDTNLTWTARANVRFAPDMVVYRASGFNRLSIRAMSHHCLPRSRDGRRVGGPRGAQPHVRSGAPGFGVTWPVSVVVTGSTIALESMANGTATFLGLVPLLPNGGVLTPIHLANSRGVGNLSRRICVWRGRPSAMSR